MPYQQPQWHTYQYENWVLIFIMQLMKFILSILFIFLVGCSSSTQINDSIKSATQAQFIESRIETNPFLLTSYERIKTKERVANIYIEGDGRAWLTKKKPSLNPTPQNPMALKLASLDPNENVIYLARPCQYTKLVQKEACPQKYWTSHRFAPEVVEAMNEAIDDIKQRHHITQFNLIGFSGGGNIAALLTARRNDILSLRTVAGNLDHQIQSEIHDVTAMPHSLNAKNIADRISYIPQIHFVGATDKIVPTEVSQSYLSQMSNDSCTHRQMVPNVGHIDGWEEVWTTLLKQKPTCIH